MLPRLKYHNPTVDMNVDRTAQNDGPATLTVFFHSQSSSSPADTSEQTDPKAIVKTIDMKNKTDKDIWSEFVTLAEAKDVQATGEDKLLLQELAEQEKASAADSGRMKEENRRIKRDKQMLEAARKDMNTED